MDAQELQLRFAEEEREALKRAVAALMLHKDTRKLLAWLLTEGKALGNQPFAGDALLTAFNCGEMQMGHRVLELILETNPSALTSLLMEIRNDREDRDRAVRAADRPEV